MTENEQKPIIDLDAIDSEVETKEAMNRASEDEIIQVVVSSMEAIQNMMYQCNAAVTAIAARVETLESFVAHFVEKDPELRAKIDTMKKATAKYGKVAAEPTLQGQILRSMSEETSEADQKSLLTKLKTAGAVPQDAELLTTKDKNEPGATE